MNKRTIQQSIDARLSGLAGKPEARDAVFRAVRGGKQPAGKRRFRVAVLAAVLIVLMAGIALAVHSTLFSLFSPENPPLQYVAEHAQPLEPTSPPTHGASTESAPVWVDSAYFDGSSLFVAYRLVGGEAHTQPYTPTEAELTQMRREENAVMPMLQEADPVMERFLEAYRAGQPYGYHTRSIGRSDHVVAGDGTDIPWAREEKIADGEDLLCYVEFDAPLPLQAADAGMLTLQFKFYLNDLYVWFDGESLFSRNAPADEYLLRVPVAKSNSVQIKTLEGEGVVNGKHVKVQAEISPLYIRLVYAPSPGVEFAILDPAANAQARAISVEAQPDGGVLQTFEGFGYVPSDLKVCPVLSSEGGESPMGVDEAQGIHLQ